MTSTKKIEQLISKYVSYSIDKNILIVNEKINENNFSDNDILIVKKIVKLLNNNRQLSNLEISDLIEKVQIL